MAKSDSFFIRATVPTQALTYQQTAVDLGFVVDALGKTVLRIHNIAVQYGGPTSTYAGAPNSSTSVGFQLTTQSQTALVNAADKSIISTGRLAIATSATEVVMMSESLDVAPQHWTNGYLVGVEQIYLGVDQTFDHVNEVTIVLECTAETLSQSAAMALALSQQ